MGIFDGITICSDIDGTLTHKGEVSAENAAAVRYFQQNGGIFVLCTGRGRSYLEKFENDFAISPFTVSANGTVITDMVHQKIVASWYFSEQEIDRVNLFLKEVTDLEKNHLVVKQDTYIKFDQPIHDLSDQPRPIRKIVLVFKTVEAAEAAEKQMQQDFGEKYTICRSWPFGVEIMPIGSGKGACVKKLKEILKEKAKLMVAVGDYDNDISMLDAADLAYGVSGGSKAILSHVDHLTPPAKEHAIAFVIKELEEMQRAKYLY